MHDAESQLILAALRDNRKRTVALLSYLKEIVRDAKQGQYGTPSKAA